jgi:hypothetical protein
MWWIIMIVVIGIVGGAGYFIFDFSRGGCRQEQNAKEKLMHWKQEDFFFVNDNLSYYKIRKSGVFVYKFLKERTIPVGAGDVMYSCRTFLADFDNHTNRLEERNGST